MWRKRVLGAASTSLVLTLLFCIGSCKSNRGCSYPSSCGNISNICCPFLLKGNPQQCDSDHPTFELDCHNNRTILNFDSSRFFYVEAINYDNFSIRVVDPGLHKDNRSSLPIHYLSLMDIFICDYGIFYSYDPLLSFSNGFWGDKNTPLVFMDCLAPVNSTRYIDIISSSSSNYRRNATSSSNFSSLQKQHYSYVVFGRFAEINGGFENSGLSDMENSCSISKVTWASSLRPPQIDSTPTTYSDIHDAMLYGFELLWHRVYCKKCRAKGGYCELLDNVVKCVDTCYPSAYFRDINGCSLLQIFWVLIGYCLSLASLIGKVLAARFALGILCLFALLVYKQRRRHLSMDDTIEDFLQSQNNLMPIRYSYWEIKKITNGFKHKLGEGGYGTVYKGKLRSGILVAVKMMGKSKATGQDFINEVATIGRIHHVNVVQLVGFCSQGSKRALVYDFMPNGSLEKYIFPREEGNVSLSCEKMYEIACKVASGIEYLHRGCEMQILHFDIKPHNILLDENFSPKISDFGLAKLYATDDSIVTLTAARGTLGYMAPELFYKNIGGVSYKADVYSFGMLLMEMAGRRKNVMVVSDHPSQIYFPSWVYDQFSQGKDIEMGDATEEEREMVKKMIIVALWCIQLKPSDRPSMNKVVEMLEGNVELLQMPPKPFPCPQEMPAAVAKKSRALLISIISSIQNF